MIMVTTCIPTENRQAIIYSIDCTTIEKHNTLIQKPHVHVDKVLHLMHWDWCSMEEIHMSTKDIVISDMAGCNLICSIPPFVSVTLPRYLSTKNITLSKPHQLFFM